MIKCVKLQIHLNSSICDNTERVIR